MPNDQPDKVVKLTLNGSGLPVPDQDPIEVKKDNQKIKWCADFTFSIQIENYLGQVKYSTGGSDCPNTAKTDYFNSAAGTRYKYSITANGKVNDPDIDIKP